MIQEALRWGEPYYQWVGEETLVYALPFTYNAELCGGLVVECLDPEDDDEQLWLAQVRRSARELLDLLETLNLTNGALLRERATANSRERLRAEAIHARKDNPLGEIRQVYWHLEPELFMAMRREDRNESTRILNQILMSIYSYAGEDLGKIKGFVLDLVSMMTRTMIECGADPAKTLGSGFDSMTALSEIHDEETLSHWVANILNQLITTVETSSAPPDHLRMQLAVNYIREHCGEPITRDSVAQKLGLSPAHFSRTVRAALGHSFSRELTNQRMDRAAKLLRSERCSVKETAARCGYEEQSYFTKVFKKNFGESPSSFKKST